MRLRRLPLEGAPLADRQGRIRGSRMEWPLHASRVLHHHGGL